MKQTKRWIALFSLFTMITTSTANIQAEEYCTDTGGCAYESAYDACRVAPAIALALVAIGLIVATGLQNQGHSGHGHAHSD